MRSAIVHRAARMRSGSLHTSPPPRSSQDYSSEHATIAASILYQSPRPTQSGLPLYILNAAAFPDADEVDYDSLLPYVLARLPDEDELIAGTEYEVVFFAGGQPETATGDKKNGPGAGWYIRVYQVLSRALRKRLQKIWIVHERSWVRVLTEVFGTIVSPKFKKKIVHVNSLSGLSLHIPLENILIPPAVYLHDRRLVEDIYVPYATGCRAFGAETPFPTKAPGQSRFPRVLRETTAFLLTEHNLRTEGVFRIPPHSLMVGILREAYDRGQHFIVWKEGSSCLSEPGTPQKTLAEVHESEAYGVHLAAALIKVWYRELRSPVFPEDSYEGLRRAYGSPDVFITPESLTDLLSPRSTQSSISPANRAVLTKHLLPLLSIVSSYQANNRMTAENLAVCFAPTLIHGSDQLQDAKMSTIIRRFLTEAICQWSEGLEQACDSSEDDFFTSLQPPNDADDYEDPLSENPSSPLENGVRRIQLSDGTVVEKAPALPPRTSSALPLRTSSLNQNTSPAKEILTSTPRRKPAPGVANLPRYSAVVPGSGPPAYVPPTFTKESMPEMIDTQNGFFNEKNGIEPIVNPPQKEAANSPDSAAGLLAEASPIPVDTSRSVSPLLAPSVPQPQTTQVRSVSAESAKSMASNDDALFIKPTWAASSRKTSASSATSTSQRKPTPPPSVPKQHSGDGRNRIDGGAAPPYVPRPRAPSPGLLQRMQSWEREEAAERSGSGALSAVGGRRQSVDDLRRLYEERASTVASMAPVVRTRSDASAGSVA